MRPAHDGCQRRVSGFEEIEHLDLNLFLVVLERPLQNAGGRVVSFTESRRQNQNFLHYRYNEVSSDR